MPSAAPKTPALRLIELQREVQMLSMDLAEQQVRADKAEMKLQRYTDFSGGVSFGGIPAAQIWADLILWESLLNDKKFRAVIELGTWQGGFAWWMWAQAKARDMMFHTFDVIVPDREMPPDTFTRMDVFIEHERIIDLLREWEPLVLFCDNGNKPRELRTFGTALQHHDSLVVVHDWGTEIQPEDVPEELEMVYEPFCKELGSISRVFRRRQE